MPFDTDYIKNGGKYQIPKDYYERLKYLFELPEKEGRKLAGEDYGLWKYVHEFFRDKDIAFSDIEPSVIDYRDAQRNVASKTISQEERRQNISEWIRKSSSLMTPAFSLPASASTPNTAETKADATAAGVAVKLLIPYTAAPLMPPDGADGGRNQEIWFSGGLGIFGRDKCRI